MLQLNNYQGVLNFDEISETFSPIDIPIDIALNIQKGDTLGSEFLKLFNPKINSDELYTVIGRYWSDKHLCIEIGDYRP